MRMLGIEGKNYFLSILIVGLFIRIGVFDAVAQTCSSVHTKDWQDETKYYFDYPSQYLVYKDISGSDVNYIASDDEELNFRITPVSRANPCPDNSRIRIWTPNCSAPGAINDYNTLSHASDWNPWFAADIHLDDGFYGTFFVEVQAQTRGFTGISCKDYTWKGHDGGQKTFCRVAPSTASPGALDCVNCEEGTTVAKSSVTGNVEIKLKWDENGYCGPIQLVRARRKGSTIWSEWKPFVNELSFYESEYGSHEYELQVRGSGTYFDGTNFDITYAPETIVVDVVPSCELSSFISSQVRITDSQGETVFSGASNSAFIEVEQGEVYELSYNVEREKCISYLGFNISCKDEIIDVPDFRNHYTFVPDDGEGGAISSTDLTLSNTGSSSYQFTVNAEIGSYKFHPVKGDHLKKADNTSYCPSFEPVHIFVGGTDQTVYEPCLVILPDDIEKIFPSVKIDQFQNAVLEHFTHTVQSGQGVIIRPQNGGGEVHLQNGAQILLDPVEPVTNLESPDDDMNWVKSFAYDELGHIVSESKSFFDNGGRTLQVQVKNLSGGFVLAEQAIYDRLGRPVIQTLPAPLETHTETGLIAQCPADRLMPGQTQYFLYKDDFVKTVSGKLSYVDFDLGSNKVQLSDNEPGTLGWYYGPNNNATSTSGLKEPYVASTDYPFSQSIYHEDGSGEVKTSLPPGNAYRTTTGYEHVGEAGQVQPVSLADFSGGSLLSEWLAMRNSEVFPTSPLTAEQLVGNLVKQSVMDDKAVAEDLLGNTVTTWTDRGGNTLITLVESGAGKRVVSFKFFDGLGRIRCSLSPLAYEQYTAGTAFADIDKTSYAYDGRGRLRETVSLDAGKTTYKYRRDGLLRFSENAQQRIDKAYSYVIYDRLGRVVESGEYSYKLSGVAYANLGPTHIENRTMGGGISGGSRDDVVKTYYDISQPDCPSSFTQDFLRGKIAATERINGGVITHKTWYSYDERGRVMATIQDINGLGNKTISYQYDGGGRIKQVLYQDGQSDAFYHGYEYDLDGRLLKAWSKEPGEGWANRPIVFNYDPVLKREVVNDWYADLQATYYYYNHGPLKRVELGENNIQGIDYVYTVEGWLKSINHPDADKDPGADASSNSAFAPDVFGMTLEYYSGDYTKSGTALASLSSGVTVPEHYDGNIRASGWLTSSEATMPSGSGRMYEYSYDHRNQLLSATMGGVDYATHKKLSMTNGYHVNGISYDVNGNIQKLKRYGAGAILHDLNYIYDPAIPNRLKSVSGHYNYGYNAIGQLSSQQKVGGSSISFAYNADGLVESISDGTGSPKFSYIYDESGQRISKKDETNGLQTWYVRDINGQIVARYDNNSGGVDIQEYSVYGLSRIGTYYPSFDGTRYEIKDHLGSVRAVINSIKKSDGTAEVYAWSDYYPFGLKMPERHSGTDYQYGYQGEFAEDETNETGFNTFELRLYDPVIGRWMTTDPEKEFYSPYLSLGNNPLAYVDPDGADRLYYDQDGIYLGTVETGFWSFDWLLGDKHIYLTGDQAANTGYMYYAWENNGGNGHAVLVDASTLEAWEVNHPIINGKVVDGLENKLKGGIKSRAYYYSSIKDKEFLDGKKYKRGDLYLSLVFVPDMASTREYLDSHTGEPWKYNFFYNNCKTYCVKALDQGGANVKRFRIIDLPWRFSVGRSLEFNTGNQTVTPYER